MQKCTQDNPLHQHTHSQVSQTQLQYNSVNFYIVRVAAGCVKTVTGPDHLPYTMISFFCVLSFYSQFQFKTGKWKILEPFMGFELCAFPLRSHVVLPLPGICSSLCLACPYWLCYLPARHSVAVFINRVILGGGKVCVHGILIFLNNGLQT